MGPEPYKIWADPNKRRIYVHFSAGVGEHNAKDIAADTRAMVARLGPGPFDIISDLRDSAGIPTAMVVRMAEALRWLKDHELNQVVRVVTSEFVADQFHRVSRNIPGYHVHEVTSMGEAESLLDAEAAKRARAADGVGDAHDHDHEVGMVAAAK